MAFQTDDTPLRPRWPGAPPAAGQLPQPAAGSALRDETHPWDLTVIEGPSGELPGWVPRLILAALAETG